MNVFVYLIKSIVDSNFYVGITENIQRRLKEHNSGKVKSTEKRGPFILVYSKKYDSYDSARKHEKWLKKKNHLYKEKLKESNKND